MRTTAVLMALAPVVLSSAIPVNEKASAVPSLDKRQDLDLQSHGEKTLKADLYAAVAASNQQIYQATQQSSDWKTCNPLNIIVRREW